MTRSALSRWSRLLFAVGCAWVASAMLVGAQAPAQPGGLPAEIAALMPAGATGITGTWSAMGTMAMGQVHAEVRGTSTCDGKAAAGTIGLEIMSESRQALLAMYAQGWQQKSVEAKNAVVQDAEQRQQEPLKVRVGDVKEEKVPGGTVVYFDYTDGCVASPKPTHTTTSLKAVVQQAGVFVSFSIVVASPAAEARALAGEILSKLSKTNFSTIAAK